MADNVSQALEQNSKSLLQKLATNVDLCNVLLGLLGKCIVISHECCMPIEGIEFGRLATTAHDNGDLTISSKMTLHELAVRAPAVFPSQSDFAVFTRAKAYGLAMALEKNPRIDGFFQKVITTMENYSEHRGLAFEALVVKQAIITQPERMLVLKIGRNLLE